MCSYFILFWTNYFHLLYHCTTPHFFPPYETDVHFLAKNTSCTIPCVQFCMMHLAGILSTHAVHYVCLLFSCLPFIPRLQYHKTFLVCPSEPHPVLQVYICVLLCEKCCPVVCELACVWCVVCVWYVCGQWRRQACFSWSEVHQLVNEREAKP